MQKRRVGSCRNRMRGKQGTSRERTTTQAGRSNLGGYRSWRRGWGKWLIHIAKDPLFVAANYYLAREGFENRNMLFILVFSRLEHKIAFKYAVNVISYVVIYLLFMPLLWGKVGKELSAGDSVNGPKHAWDAPGISIWLEVRWLCMVTYDLYVLPCFSLQKHILEGMFKGFWEDIVITVFEWSLAGVCFALKKKAVSYL